MIHKAATGVALFRAELIGTPHICLLIPGPVDQWSSRVVGFGLDIFESILILLSLQTALEPFLFSNTLAISSLKSWNTSWCRKCHSSKASQTMSSSGQAHTACKGSSCDVEHRSQEGLSIMVLRTRSPLLEENSYQIKFFTLF